MLLLSPLSQYPFYETPRKKFCRQDSGEELISCITLGSPGTLDECLGHRQGGYRLSEVYLQPGHGTRWYPCHCVKPSFLILSSMFTHVHPFPSLILNPIVIYVVLRTTSNPLRNKYNRGIPGWPSGTEFACQYRRCKRH